MDGARCFASFFADGVASVDDGGAVAAPWLRRGCGLAEREPCGTFFGIWRRFPVTAERTPARPPRRPERAAPTRASARTSPGWNTCAPEAAFQGKPLTRLHSDALGALSMYESERTAIGEAKSPDPWGALGPTLP
jgi:hypothetical protein